MPKAPEITEFQTVNHEVPAILYGLGLIVKGEKLTRDTSALRSNLGACMPIAPVPSGQNELGDFDRFTEFARRLVAVPHAEIKAKLDAERDAKRTSKASASRAFAVQPTRPN